MLDHIPSNREFSVLAGLSTSMLCIIFGANAVAIKISLLGFGKFTAAGLRFTIAAGVLFLWTRAARQPLRLQKGQLRQLLVIAGLFVLQMSLLYWGLSKTYASRGTLLINLQPFFVLFLAHYFIPGDRMSARKVIGLLLGFAGVLFVFLEKEGVTAEFRLGDIMILTTSAIWACRTVYLKRIIENFRPVQIVFYSMFMAAPFFLLESWLFDQSAVRQVDSAILGALLYQALITASIGFVAWNTLLQKYGAVALHSFLFIMPVAGVLLGGFVLGEPVTGNILLSMLLIASGILVVHYHPEKHPRLVTFLRGL